MRVVPVFQLLLDPLKALSPLCLEGMLHENVKNPDHICCSFENKLES